MIATGSGHGPPRDHEEARVSKSFDEKDRGVRLTRAGRECGGSVRAAALDAVLGRSTGAEREWPPRRFARARGAAAPACFFAPQNPRRAFRARSACEDVGWRSAWAGRAGISAVSAPPVTGGRSARGAVDPLLARPWPDADALQDARWERTTPRTRRTWPPRWTGRRKPTVKSVGTPRAAARRRRITERKGATRTRPTETQQVGARESPAAGQGAVVQHLCACPCHWWRQPLPGVWLLRHGTLGIPMALAL